MKGLGGRDRQSRIAILTDFQAKVFSDRPQTINLQQPSGLSWGRRSPRSNFARSRVEHSIYF
ncbi:MAG: hypothetical protein HC895_24900 [Leptolyngbyaceae cyanobacterium SM1_3_5]|nr:hypothetical protein [Leptolyngbyaceae cyanobacterium SM1_3_5]